MDKIFLFLHEQKNKLITRIRKITAIPLHYKNWTLGQKYLNMTTERFDSCILRKNQYCYERKKEYAF